MKKFDNIIKQMDVCGLHKIPFLFVLDFEKENGFIIEEPMKSEKILFTVREISNTYKKSNTVDYSFHSEAEAIEKYSNKFEIVKNGLMRGDSFLLNLTIKTPINTNLDLQEIFHLSKSPYSLCVPHKFVCFSPERFIFISAEGIISTNPMKGTIDANIPNAEEIIINNHKEVCEHNTIVDLMRNDLSMVANNVRVKRFRYVDRIETSKGAILQVSSEIEGKLKEENIHKFGTIIDKLTPAGSISGAPKPETINIIKKAEIENRGFYTGIFGYFDGKDFDSAVIIRYIEQENNKLFFRSGGGITVNSDMKEEYEEAIKKVYLPF